MIRYGFVCFILFVGASYVASAPNTDYVYSREADAWLRLHMVPATWANAGMRCYLEGGILASPTTSTLVNAMKAMMDEKRLTYHVFTGINSIKSKKNFKSLEGTPLNSIPLSWAPGQPDNSTLDENCVALTGAGTLADVSCDAVLPYFCRKESACGRDSGYELDSRTGSCYKTHKQVSSWREAQALCHEDGGVLAVVNSEVESQVLKELYATMMNGDYPNHVFLGFMRIGREWATVYGKTLEEAGFSSWDVNEPNNNADHEGCGSLHKNGLLNDASCHEGAPFICEITPVEPRTKQIQGRGLKPSYH